MSQHTKQRDASPKAALHLAPLALSTEVAAACIEKSSTYNTLRAQPIMLIWLNTQRTA